MATKNNFKKTTFIKMIREKVAEIEQKKERKRMRKNGRETG